MDIDDDARGPAARTVEQRQPAPVRPVDVRLRTGAHGDRMAVHVAGALDLDTVGTLRQTLLTVIAAGYTDVVVVLTESTMVDSVGPGVLVAAHTSALQRGGRVQLVVDQEGFLERLRITGADAGLHPAPHRGERAGRVGAPASRVR